MKSNFWEFLCVATHTAGVLGATFLVCATVCMIAKGTKDQNETEETAEE